jgi:hypothetical protein
MARKHSKTSVIKRPVTHTIIKPAQVTRDRVVVEVPAGTDGAIPIVQEDGSTKLFVVKFKEVSPAVVSVRALGPTTQRGQKNNPANMAPRGNSSSKSGPTKGGKK